MLAAYLGLLGADFSVSEPPELVTAIRRSLHATQRPPA
jgi:hypothetical protein